MLKKYTLLAAALLAFGFASASTSSAGTEMLTDNSAPAPTYNYTPRPVYYSPPPPPPVTVVVYPRVAYCPPPIRAFGYYRYAGHRAYCGPRFRR